MIPRKFNYMKPNKKIAIKGGLGVLEKLKSIGGTNKSYFKCKDDDLYYWISSSNYTIQCSEHIPIGYTIINLDYSFPEEEELTFPRVMLVSDFPITKDNPGIKNVVFVYLQNLELPYIAYEIDTIEELQTIQKVRIRFWKYAQEINQPTILRVTMNQIAEKFNVDSVEIIKE